MTGALLGIGLRRSRNIVALAVLACGCNSVSAGEPEADLLIGLLALERGMTVADVGAGEGSWTEALAAAVGSEGRVYATEVEQQLVDELSGRMTTAGISNVTPVLGDQSGTGLPADCCDAILLRMVYHHFQDPSAMRASLRGSLRAGGLLAIVDINPQRHWRTLEGVPERGGHGIEPRELIREMTEDGFALVSRHDDWNGDEERYCVLFRRLSSAALQ